MIWLSPVIGLIVMLAFTSIL
ncbi:archaellin/type IV pilin N-terminal domain-containing protein [Photobacterium leiognathi]